MTSQMDIDAGGNLRNLEDAFRRATSPAEKLRILYDIGVLSGRFPDVRMAQSLADRWRKTAVKTYGLDPNDVGRVLAEGAAEGRRQVEAQNADGDRKVIAFNGKPLPADLHCDAPRKPRTKNGDDDLATMNDKYAVVQVGGRMRVMYFEESPAHPGSKVPVFQRKEDFVSFQMKYKKTFTDGNGREKETGIGHWWLNHPERRQYRDVVYAPGAKPDVDIFNLWRGFSCKEKQGDCGLFLEHLRENICAGVEEHFEYLVNWMAMGVQCPDRQGEVAIVLRGKEGTGKGTFANTYGRLFGPHFWPVCNAHHLVGHFNSRLQQTSVLFADEAFFAGDRTYESILKSLITEPTINIEPKGIDTFPSPNRLHIIISSNANWVIPAGAEARRFFMLDVSAARMQDRAYFHAIDCQLKTGGYEALLFYLRHRDLSRFDVGVVPQTEALAKQKAFSRRDVDRLIETIAHRGTIPAARPPHLNVGVTSGEDRGEGFYVFARALSPDLKHLGSITISRLLKEEWGCKSWHSGNLSGIEFPSLQKLRQLFDQKHGPQEWPSDGPVEWGDGI